MIKPLCKIKPLRKQQEGVVIIVALFIVALVASLSYVMIARLERDTSRSAMIIRHVQAEYYAQGSVAWAMDVLRSHLVNKKNDQLVDRMPIKSPVNRVGEFSVGSVIYDMQSRFNINNLSSADFDPVPFIKFLTTVVPGLEQAQAQSLYRGIRDWLLKNNATSENEFTKYYGEQTPAYRAARRNMLSITELRLIKGVTPRIYQALEPYLAALPIPTKLNINTLSPPLLLFLNQKITMDHAKSVVASLAKNPFISKNDLTKLPLLTSGANQKELENFTTISQYFLVETTVTIDKQKLILYTLLERPESTSGKVTILWQSKGVI